MARGRARDEGNSVLLGVGIDDEVDGSWRCRCTSEVARCRGGRERGEEG